MAFRFHRDGSLDMILVSVSLLGAYPAIDGVPLRPLACSVTENEVVFTLAKGSLALRVEENAQGITVSCHVSGLTGAHDVSPMANACVQGCNRVFRQGFGIGGPSGFAASEDTVNSDALIGLNGDAGCCAVYAKDNAKYRIHYHMEQGKLASLVDLEGTAADDLALPELYIVQGEDISDLLTACAKDIACTMGAPQPRSRHMFPW